MINKRMHKITLYKIENKVGDDKYIVSDTPVANGEALADYNNIEELYPNVTTTDTTFQNYVVTATCNAIAGSETLASSRAAVGVLNSIYQSGTGNSQFGTQWIYSEKEKLSKKIRVTDDIPEDWLKGRKIKFEDNENDTKKNKKK